MIPKPDLAHYLTLSHVELLRKLAEVTESVCEAHAEVSLAEAAEVDARIDGWMNSRESTIKGREWAASTNSAGPKQALVDKRADLAVLQEVKWFILRLLDDGHSGRSTDGPT